MQIIENDAQHIIEVWISRDENKDPETQKKLKAMIACYRSSSHPVCVFISGSEDLYGSTLPLLLHNRTSASTSQ